MDNKMMLRRTSERFDKTLFGIAAAVASILATSSAVMSYSALRQLAIQSEISKDLAYLFPITLDGLIISGSTLVLFAASRGKRAWGGMFLIVLGVAASTIGNISISPGNFTAQAVHATPPLILFLSLEALTSLMRQRINESIVRDEVAIAEERKDAKIKRTPTVIRPAPLGGNTSSALTSQTGRLELPHKSVSYQPGQSLIGDNFAPVKVEGISKSIREQINEVLDINPEVDISELANSIESGDKKYVRRIIREELGKRTTTL